MPNEPELSISEQLTAAKKQNDELSARVTQLLKDLDTAKATHEAALATLKAEVEAAKQANADLTNANQALVKDRDEMKVRAEKAEADLKPLNQKVAEIMAQVGVNQPVGHDAQKPATTGQTKPLTATERCLAEKAKAKGAVPTAS